MAVVATGRIRHDERVPDAPRGRIPKDATQRERMARRLRTKPGRADYARRKSIVDQVFEQMKTRKHARHLRLRGVAGAKGEWTLHATCHNLRKLANTAKTAPLPGTRPSARVPWRHGSGGSTRIDKSPAMILAQIRPNLDQQQKSRQTTQVPTHATRAGVRGPRRGSRLPALPKGPHAPESMVHVERMVPGSGA